MAQSGKYKPGAVRKVDQVVLLSVKPAYAHLLVTGTKTIELRRRFPEGIAVGTTILIYASSPIQAVIGECLVDSVTKLPLAALWKKAARNAMIPWEDFKSYFSGKTEGVAIAVKAARQYDHPVPLALLEEERGFSSPAVAPQSYCYVEHTV